MSVSSSNRLLCDENTHSNSSAYVSVEHNTKNIAMDTKASNNLMEGPVKGHKNTMRSYRRLKFFFTMMLLLNALLLMVVIICMLLIVPHMSTMNNRQEPQPTPMPQSPHMKCLSIQTKLNRLYRNGQMVDKVNDDEECSMEDLMDSFIQVLYAIGLWLEVMVLNATLSNISVISWRSVLLVEETGGPGENHRPVTRH